MGAWSDMGAAISIDSALNYNYYNSNEKKYYSGKITKGYWDTINQKLEQIKYKTLDTTLAQIKSDNSAYEMIITCKSGKRRITREWENDIDSISATLNWLNNSYKHVKLLFSPKPIKFETIYQNVPPAPKTKDAKFPPPNEN